MARNLNLVAVYGTIVWANREIPGVSLVSVLGHLFVLLSFDGL